MLQSTQTQTTAGLLITITPEHIASGVICDHNQCPIAQAIGDSFPDHYITVGANQIIITPNQAGQPRYIFTQSTLVQEWVRLFDSNQHPGPIQIYLDYTNHTAHLVKQQSEPQP